MGENVSEKMGRGISPTDFIERMTRNRETFENWGAQFSWPSEEDKKFYESLRKNDQLKVMIIAADWCGDVVRNIPVVFRLVEHAGLPTEVFIMEEHLDLMDRFLTMGGRSIPVVLFVDPAGEVKAKWGPRPAHVQEVMVRFKTENPNREAPDYDENLKAARAEMGARYGEGPGYQVHVVREIRELLS